MSERIYKGSERLFKATKFNNLKEMIVNTKEKYGDKTAFKFKSETDGTISTMTYDDYIEEVNSLGTALISIGLKDKRIGVISENRYEWEEAYLSIVFVHFEILISILFVNNFIPSSTKKLNISSLLLK